MRRSLLFQVILMLAVGMALRVPAHAQQQQFYTDIPITDFDLEAIQNAAANQLMEGYPDGAFHPEYSVRHRESVLVMARLLNVSYKGFMVLPSPTVVHPLVTGVPARHWLYPAARFLAQHGMLDNTVKISPLAATPVTRGELLTDLSRLLHMGDSRPLEESAQEFADDSLLPDGWKDCYDAPVTRRELARLLDNLLNYLTQHAVAEGTITAFETDENGDRWVHLDTAIGEARLCMPTRGIIVQGGSEDTVRAGMKIQTLSDVVAGTHSKPYFRVREVTILARTASAR